MPVVTVLLPTYQGGLFMPRALESLRSQSMEDWELIVIDDGSTDGTRDVIQSYLLDARIRYLQLEINRGLGAALNEGLRSANSPLIAYLPVDDLFYQEHLSSLLSCLEENPRAVLAYSGVRHHYNRMAPGGIDGYPLQLVQVMHRRTPDFWMERSELVTDDLDRMFWSKLEKRGESTASRQITCEWVDHPHQRHKIIQEPVGGINLYRQRFNVSEPLRFHTTVGNLMDEVEHYRQFRERPDSPKSPDGLKILLVGELAYNPERILALEERGHSLYGLWMPDPYWYNYVGPLPFGHVQDIPRDNWKEAVREIKPDIIYALLNWQAVPFVHAVLHEIRDIPFVWHFKEGPFICLEKGLWSELLDIYNRCDAHIYSSPEMRAWFETIIPGAVRNHPSLILDGDLPKREWFNAKPSNRLSETDGEIHTVVPGRPIGLHPHNVAELAENGIHLHFYGNFTHKQWLEWIEKTKRLAPRHIHLHGQVDQEDWVTEFSQYDAGWLHFFKSENAGEIRRANWDDLNYPARIGTLVAAGLPLLQRDNCGHIVASQDLAKTHNLGLFFEDMNQLRELITDEARMAEIRSSIWKQREKFTFDDHADELISFFRAVVHEKQ